MENDSLLLIGVRVIIKRTVNGTLMLLHFRGSCLLPDMQDVQNSQSMLVDWGGDCYCGCNLLIASFLAWFL